MVLKRVRNQGFHRFYRDKKGRMVVLGTWRLVFNMTGKKCVPLNKDSQDKVLDYIRKYAKNTYHIEDQYHETCDAIVICLKKGTLR